MKQSNMNTVHCSPKCNGHNCIIQVTQVTSPKERRELYVKFIEKKGKLLVNRNNSLQLNREPALRDLLKKGILVRVREGGSSGSTFLKLNKSG